MLRTRSSNKMQYTQVMGFLIKSCSIGHPPHSLASPVELRLRAGPHTLSELIFEGIRGEEFCLSIRNAPKGSQLGVNK